MAFKVFKILRHKLLNIKDDYDLYNVILLTESYFRDHDTLDVV